MLSLLRTASLNPSKSIKKCYKNSLNVTKIGFRGMKDYVMPPYLRLSKEFYNWVGCMPLGERSVLDNGLTIGTLPRDSSSACVGLFFDAGSKWENSSNNGIGHLFEHFVYKGTQCCTFAGIESRMKVLGAHFKSFTTREFVGYYAECLAEDVEEVVSLIVECVYTNAYDAVTIANARQALYDELVERNTDLDGMLYDLLYQTAFQGTKLAQSIYGNQANLDQFTPEKIYIHNQKRHHPKNAILAGCGGVTHAQMVDLAMKYVCGAPAELSCGPGDFYRFTGAATCYRDDTRPMANSAIAVEAPNFCHPDALPLKVASELIGGWDRSQVAMHHPNYAARGLFVHSDAVAYKSFYHAFPASGLWGIQFMCGSHYIIPILDVFQSLMMRLCVDVADSELEKAKSQVKRKILSKAESLEKSLIDMAQWFLYTEWMPTIQSQLKDLEKLHGGNITQVCQKYVYDKCPAVACVGPTEGMPTYSRLRAGMYWLRF